MPADVETLPFFMTMPAASTQSGRWPAGRFSRSMMTIRSADPSPASIPVPYQDSGALPSRYLAPLSASPMVNIRDHFFTAAYFYGSATPSPCSSSADHRSSSNRTHTEAFTLTSNPANASNCARA